MTNGFADSHGPFAALQRVDPAVAGILVLAMISGVLVVARTWEYGIGLTPDSVGYVSMARDLATGHDAFAGERMRPTWPPLFTLIISVPGVVGVDPIDAAAVFNPSILVCICLVSGLWLYRRTNSGFVSLIVTATLAFSIPLTRISSFVWTEPLFVLFTVCSLVLLDRHLRTDSLGPLVLAALLAALACLTRYAGVALLASTALLVLFKPEGALKKKGAQALLYSMVAVLPVSLWLLRNHLLFGTFTGGRSEGVWSFGENAERVILTLGQWAVAWRRSDDVLDVLIPGIPWLAMLGFALAWGWSSSRSRGIRETILRLELSEPFVRVLGAYAVAYIAFIVMASTAVRIDPIGDRLLAPTFVPLALLAGFVVARLIALSRCDRGGRFGRAFAAVIVLVAASHVAAYVPELRFAAGKGHGYASRTWEMSESIAWIRRTGAQPLLSNHADALYLIVPGVAVEWLPRDIARLPATVSSLGKRRVIWFHTTRYPYDMRDLASDLGLRKVVEFDDSVVFEASQP